MDKKKASLIVILSLVITLSYGITPVFAEPKVEQFSYYDRVHNGDGTITQKIYSDGTPTRVMDEKGKWHDRIIRNNGTHFNVYSQLGSFSFDKSDCTITQYVKGYNPQNTTLHQSDIVIGEWFWTIARKNGANPWSILDASIFACDIQTKSNSTGKYLTMTRNHAATGSYLKVDLAAKKDRPVEDFAELYMNNPSWNGNKFAFVLWAKNVKTDYIQWRNGTNLQIMEGITILDRSQLNIQTMEFIKNGNAFYLDWLKAAPYLKTIILNKTGTNLDVQFGFNNNAVNLNTRSKIILDPTYGYTIGTHKSPFSAAGACTTNNGGNANGYIGSDATYCYYDSIEWDISSIPNTATITNTLTRYDVVVNVGTPTCNANKLTTQPSTTGYSTIQSEAIAGTTYAALTCSPTANDVVTDLGTAADTEVKSRLTTGDWFAYGVVRNPNGMASQLTQFTTVELEITYTITPNPGAPTNLQCVGLVGKFFCSWNAGYNSTTTTGYYFSNSTDNITWERPASPTANVTQSLYSSPIANTSKYIRVNATVSNTYNTTSSNVEFDTTDNTPAVPTGLDGIPITPTNVRVEWPAIGDYGRDELINYTLAKSVNNAAFSTITPTNKTISFWKFDGTLLDAVNATNIATLSTGTINYTIQENGTGFRFNGLTGISLPNANRYNTNNWTISAWIYPTTIAGDFRMIVASIPADQIQLNLEPGGRVQFYYNNGLRLESTPLSINTLYHVVITRADPNLKMYINGALDQPQIGVVTADPISTMYIGKRITAHPFIGKIDDVMFFNYALTELDIKNLYYNHSPPTYYSDTVVAGSNIRYELKSCNNVGCSAFTSPTYNVFLPDPVTTLSATPISIQEITLSWTQPDLKIGTLEGYKINYTTPYGNPLTMITNSTHNTATIYDVTGLTEETAYSFRVAPWTNYGQGINGNIANATTLPDFTVANFTLGYLDVNATNDQIFPIRFERTDINTTHTTLKVIYDEDFVMDCRFDYEFAQSSDLYQNITESSYSASENYTDFTFITPDNDIIHTTCYDVFSNETGRYTMTQNSFPLLEQIANFRNGTYGTMGMIGAIDFITLAIIIFSTVGFSRLNETMAAMINIALLGALWYFDIVVLPTLFIGVLAVVIVVIVGSTRRD